MPRLFTLVAHLALAALLTGCTEPDDDDDASDDDVTDDDDDDADDDGGDDDTSDLPCDIDDGVPPWPAWVPAWPGSGRNASGNTTFAVLDDGPAISDLDVTAGARSAVLRWNTAGEADSTVAWGLTAEDCSTGYHRTGGRTEHWMLLAPLQPETEYHAKLRSRDDDSHDATSISFTTAADPEPVTLLDACGAITAPGEYRLTQDVEADCTCFEISSDDASLDLGWHTVRYAQTSTAEQCHGVSITGDRTQLFGGILEQGSAGGDLYSHAIRLYGVEFTTIDAIWLRVHTADAFGLRAMYSDEVHVRGLIVVSEVEQVTDRHYPGNRGISLDLSPEDAVGSVEDCILFGVPHWGIHMTADDRLDEDPGTPQTRFIRNNHVFADMHATNGYALGLHANYIEADHNEIRPLYNGRAMHVTRSNAHVHHNIIEALERVHGDEAQGFSNYTDIADEHSPHDPSVCSWVVAHGIRVEGGNFGEIHHNEVYTYSLPDVAFGATAFNLNCEGSGGAGNQVHHNQFTAEEAPGSMTCGGGLPMIAGWVRGETPTVINDLHDNVFRSTGDTLVIEDPSLATSTNDQEDPL